MGSNLQRTLNARDFRKAKLLTSTWVEFQVKRLNIWGLSSNDPLVSPDEAREISNPEFNLLAEEAFQKGDCYLGVDISDRRDMASVGAVARYKGYVYAKTANFLNKESYDRRRAKRRERILEDFVNEGLLTIAGDKHIDYDPIYELILDWSARYKVRGIIADVMTGGRTLYDFVRRPMPARVITFKKGKVVRSQGCSYFSDMLAERRLRVVDSKLFRWELTNATVHEWPDGGKEIIRLEPDLKSGIDGCYAVIHGMFPFSDNEQKTGTLPTSLEEYAGGYGSMYNQEAV